MGIAQMQDTFQSTPLMRGETAGRGDQKPDEQISTRSPHARGDPRPLPASEDDYNFNPLPSHEGRLWASTLTRRCGNFNPLPSYEGRRNSPASILIRSYFNPLPSHEGRLEFTGAPHAAHVISIHSPHTRGDRAIRHTVMGKTISIHSPLTRGDASCIR